MERVFVHGTAVSRSWADRSASLSDLIFGATRTALDRAGVRMQDADSVVLSAHDLTDGRSLSSMVSAPAAGAYLKDEVRLGDDGAAAFIVGTARIRSGASKLTIVAAWGRASEGDADAIANALFDPFTSRPLGMTEIAVSAMRAGAALQRFEEYETWRERAAARRHAGGTALGPRASAAAPLREAEVPSWCDVVAAVVLSAQPGTVEVRGVGMSTESYAIGDRDLVGLPALRHASSQALRAADMSIDDLDVLELDGLTLFDEALAAEAVGAAPAGGGMRALAESARVNRDGGFAAGYCAPAMGLVRICEATDRLAEAGTAALATGSSVVAAQTQAAIALGRA